MTIKRYTPYIPGEMEVAPDGEWVRYSDITSDPTPEQVEQVARTLCVEDGCNWDASDAIRHVAWKRKARAAIKVMQESV